MSEAERGEAELSPAAAAFAEFLARVEDGEAVDFAAFCAEHPAVASDLRRLHQRWQALHGAFADVREASIEKAPAPSPDVSQAGIELEPDDASRSRLLRDLTREDRDRPRYAIDGEFARGGMAAILKVRDKCLRRTLAMKVLLAERRPGSGSGGALRTDPRSLARFLEEAQVTGQLDHPGIPPVHELGIDGEGRVFFTMPLIRGRNLSQVYALVREGRDGWTLPRAVAVLQRVCETVAYAHSRGVIHRDLKPSNVMVGRFGETYVMDWGLARVRGREDRRDLRLREPGEGSQPQSSIQTLRTEAADDGPDSPLITMDGQVVGTPAYMAPEQARGELTRVASTADVYSIGAMLYELMAGQMPYVPSGVRMSARTVLARVVEGPPRPLREVGGDLPDELVAICERAMARQPEARYAGVVELGEDLRAWLEGRVVRAHATGAWVELRKWILRNRALAAVSAACVLALCVGLVVTVLLGRQARQAARQLAIELRHNDLDRGRLSAQAGNLEQAERLLWAEHVKTPDSPQSRWALWDLYARHPCLATANAADELRGAVLTDGGHALAAGDAGGRVMLFEAATLTRVATLEPVDSPVTAVAADDGGLSLFSAHEDGSLRVWQLAERRLARTLRESTPISALALRPDGGALLAGTRGGELRVYDTTTWSASRAATHARGIIARVAWSPDGQRFASCGADWCTRVFEAAGGKQVAWLATSEPPVSLTFTPDGKQVLCGGGDRLVYCLDLGTGKQAWTMSKSDTVRGLHFTAGGSRLVAGGWQRVDVWSWPQRERLRSIALPVPGIILGDRTGERAFTIHQRELRAWDLADRGRRAFGAHAGRVGSSLSRDGRFLVTGDGAGVVKLFDLQAGGDGTVLGNHGSRVRTLAFGPDGTQVLSGGSDRTLRLWSTKDRTLLRTFPDHEDATCQSAVFSPDGRLVASGVTRRGIGYVVVRKVEDGSEMLGIDCKNRQVLAFAFSPDGRRLAASVRGVPLQVFDLTGRRLLELPTPSQSWTIAFRPDGRQLATGTWGRNVVVFDAGSGARQAVLEGYGGTVWCVDWLPSDPRLLFTGAADGSVRVWDMEEHRPLILLDAFGGEDATGVSVSADGSVLAASGQSPSVFVWDLSYYERLIAGNVEAQLERHASERAAAARLRGWARQVLGRPWPRR